MVILSMHIILHLAAFVVILIWAFAFFFLHASGAIHLILVLAAILFIIALFKNPGKRTIN